MKEKERIDSKGWETAGHDYTATSVTFGLTPKQHRPHIVLLQQYEELVSTYLQTKNGVQIVEQQINEMTHKITEEQRIIADLKLVSLCYEFVYGTRNLHSPSRRKLSCVPKSRGSR